MPNISD